MSLPFSLIAHLLATLARLAKPGGLGAVVAESLAVKHQLLILRRAWRRVPYLTSWDRLALGVCTLLVSPKRMSKMAVILKPSTLLYFHRTLVQRKYRLLYSPRKRRRPGPNYGADRTPAEPARDQWRSGCAGTDWPPRSSRFQRDTRRPGVLRLGGYWSYRLFQQHLALSEVHGFCGAGRTGLFGSSSVASNTAERDSTVRGSTNFEYLLPPNFSPNNFSTDV
jgi:hypothetical protein